MSPSRGKVRTRAIFTLRLCLTVGRWLIIFYCNTNMNDRCEKKFYFSKNESLLYGNSININFARQI